jgi:hypothetical protein
MSYPSKKQQRRRHLRASRKWAVQAVRQLDWIHLRDEARREPPTETDLNVSALYLFNALEEAFLAIADPRLRFVLREEMSIMIDGLRNTAHFKDSVSCDLAWKTLRAILDHTTGRTFYGGDDVYLRRREREEAEECRRWHSPEKSAARVKADEWEKARMGGSPPKGGRADA